MPRLRLKLGEPPPLAPGQSTSDTVSAVDASGNPSSATLSNLAIASSDPTVVTGVVNPDGSVTVTAQTPPVSPDSAVITVNATATEPDGVTQENISGSASFIVTIPMPPPPPAASITFGAWTPPVG